MAAPTPSASQQTLATPRLLLEPRTMADNESCFKMDSDPEVIRFIAVPWADDAAHKAFIEARTRGPYPFGQGYWTVRQKSEPTRFLGWILLMPLDAVGPDTEIGWRLRRDAWGAGFATEAARALLEHAFTTLGLAEVVADIHPENTRSVRVAEKIGLLLRGRRLHHGEPHLHYAMNVTEYRAGRDRT
jgi:RimJ/RimL family protein N-acetyltransferase